MGLLGFMGLLGLQVDMAVWFCRPKGWAEC